MIKVNRLLPWSKFATWSKPIDYCLEVSLLSLLLSKFAMIKANRLLPWCKFAMIKANRLLPWSKFATWSKPIDYCLEVSLLHDQSQ